MILYCFKSIAPARGEQSIEITTHLKTVGERDIPNEYLIQICIIYYPCCLEMSITLCLVFQNLAKDKTQFAITRKLNVFLRKDVKAQTSVANYIMRAQMDKVIVVICSFEISLSLSFF